MTNAHVVAGTTRVTRAAGSAVLAARVVLVRPAGRRRRPLDVPGIWSNAARCASPTTLAHRRGSPWPRVPLEDGPFQCDPVARARPGQPVLARHLRCESPARREAYMLRGDIRPGNSGGPDDHPEGGGRHGVRGQDKASDETGFALTAAQLRSHSAQGGESEAAVPTGACVSG